jgi:hypothetical protein
MLYIEHRFSILMKILIIMNLSVGVRFVISPQIANSLRVLKSLNQEIVIRAIVLVPVLAGLSENVDV